MNINELNIGSKCETFFRNPSTCKLFCIIGEYCDLSKNIFPNTWENTSVLGYGWHYEKKVLVLYDSMKNDKLQILE